MSHQQQMVQYRAYSFIYVVIVTLCDVWRTVCVKPLDGKEDIYAVAKLGYSVDLLQLNFSKGVTGEEVYIAIYKYGNLLECVSVQ